MEYLILLLCNEEDENKRKQQKNVNIIRRNLRDSQNPFDIEENTFRKLYRLSKEATIELIEELLPYMPLRKRSTAIPEHIQIFATLHFLSSGSYQRKVGQDFLSCMSQTSVSVSIHVTINALNKIMRHWIQFPTGDVNKQQFKEEFFINTGFPDVIGAIDGTHVAIFPPETAREHLFINRKLYHSLNVMIVSSYNSVILAVNAMHGGRMHDSRVFCSSYLLHHLQRQQEIGEKGSWLIGDAAYPLMPFLLKSFINPPVESPESRYNKHIIQARSSVERCIGILKGRWRCSRKERALHYKPEFAACIINACCVLHNIAVKWRLPLEEMYLDDIDQDLRMPYNDNNANNAEEIRRNVVRWHFQQ